MLFVEFEKFFQDKNTLRLSEFIGININLNFSNKENTSYKELVYLQFYNKFLIFKFIKILFLNFLRLFNKINSGKDIVYNVVNLINFINKIIPKKCYEKSNEKIKMLLNEIKIYHSKDYKDFKKKLDPILHILND